MDEFIRFRCPSCEKRLKAPRKYAARKVRCSCGQSITAPDVEKAVVPAVRPTPVRVEHTLQRFSAGLVMFLGLVTFNMFAMIRLFWLHGNFPIRRPTDPTAARAIIGALIPGFNLVWAPFALGRLVTRLNEQRRETGLPELRLNALVAAFVVCMVAGPIATFPLRWLLDDGQFALTLLIGGPLLNWLLIVPMLASSIQNGINALVDAAKAPGAKLSFAPGRDSAAFLVKTELQWRSRQRTAWGIYLSVFGIANFTIICLVLFMDRNHDGKATVAIMNFLFVSLPFFLGASTLFVRAWLMAARRKRLDREPEQAFAMVAAERRTTMLYQLFWGGVFALFGLAILGMLIVTEILPRGLHYYSVIDTVLTPLLLFVLPAWITAVYFLIRVYQAFAHRPEPEAPPVSGLQLTPTSIWPALGGAVLAVLLIGMTAVWSRLDHRALTTAVAPSSRPVQTADSNIDGGKKVTLQLTQESLFGSWKAPGAGDFKEIFAHFDKNGSGCLRGTFAAGGGIRWDFQYEIDAAMNTAVLYADGKRRGAVELTSKSEIRVTIPDVGLFGPECNFTRDMK